MASPRFPTVGKATGDSRETGPETSTIFAEKAVA